MYLLLSRVSENILNEKLKLQKSQHRSNSEGNENRWMQVTLKSASAVSPAGSAQPTTEKPKADAKDAKAHTEWAPRVPSTTVPLRRKE